MRDLKVSHLKVKGFEVSFHADAVPYATKPLETRQEEKKEEPKNLPEKPIENIRVEGSVVPQGLDEEMGFDKILNWSAPVDEGSVPLTNDEVMTEPVLVSPQGGVNA